jgi:hypothetical protein
VAKVFLKKLLMTPAEMTDPGAVHLEWNAWQRRLPPYHDLQPGVRVILVDGPPDTGTLAWEVEATAVVKGRYDDLDAAFDLIAPLTAGTGVDRAWFTSEQYTVGAATPGWLLAWTFVPVRVLGFPRTSAHVLQRHGWGTTDKLTVGGVPPRSGPRSGRRPGGGQGRVQDPVLRTLIEVAAMDRVRQWLRRAGWADTDIRDTSAGHPYDFEVGPAGSPAFRIEVKGTQGDLAAVTVTAGEVNAARTGGVRTVLAIVHDIRLIRGAGGTWSTRGGTLWRDDDWQPDDARLTATQYRYQPV